MQIIMDAANKVIDKVASMFKQALDYLVQIFQDMINWLFNLVIDLFNFFIQVAAKFVDLLAAFLPESDLAVSAPAPGADPASFYNFVNWVLPLDVMAVTLGAIALSYIAYFTIGRLLKIIQVL